MARVTAPAIDYRTTGIAVRGDIIASQTRAWETLGSSGTWWTGAERVAIAREVRAARHCAACAERKAAVSPYAVNRPHAAASDLPPAIVDAIHRVVTDPGRLSRRWVGEVIAAGVTDAQLVELVGVVCTVMLVDGFARAIGADLPPLPAPAAGDPSRQRPPEAVDEGYFVPTIPYAVGQRPELGLYEPAPFMPNVGRGLSLVPDTMRTARDLMLAHYMKYEEVATGWEPKDRPITRSQMELVASRTSAKNDCFY
jgi:alkylhydroperoxidase family enzyme